MQHRTRGPQQDSHSETVAGTSPDALRRLGHRLSFYFPLFQECLRPLSIMGKLQGLGVCGHCLPGRRDLGRLRSPKATAVHFSICKMRLMTLLSEKLWS